MKIPTWQFLFGVGALVISHLAAAQPTANPAYQTGFPLTLNGTRVRHSSVTLGDLTGEGLPDIVVGTTDGKVHAYTGAGSKLWEFDTGNMAIEGKVAIEDLDLDGTPEVVVGAGSTFTPGTHGGLYVLSHLGSLQCSFQTGDFDSDGFRDGVFSSPAVADLDGNDGGKLEIAFGAWDGWVRVLNHDCSVVWQLFVRDTVWSSPAIGDLDHDGALDVVIGVDSHVEPAFGTQDGGILHAFRGANGAELPGFPIQINEVIQSSPALGDLTGDGWLEIIVGTGRCWSDPACAPGGRVTPGVGEFLNAWDHTGKALTGWPVAIPGTYAFASPALADLDGDGALEIIVNTIDPGDSQGGMVYALNANGSNVPGWPVRPTTPAGVGTVVHFQTSASPVVADLTGNGQLEVLLASNWDLVAWNKGGNQLSRDIFPTPAEDWQLRMDFTVSSAPAVGDLDGDGDLEVVVGGANSGGGTGAIAAWDFSGPRSATALPWPMFRRRQDNRAIFQSPCTSSDTLNLSDVILSSVEEFEACRTLTAGPNVQVTSTGEVIFRSGKTIALGDGFSVDSGGSFRAVIVPALSLK